MWWWPYTQPCGLGCDMAAPLALNNIINKRNRPLKL